MAYFALVAKSAGERVKALWRVTILGLGMFLVMSPWIVRNYLLVHEFIPTATVSGDALQEGLAACQELSPERNFLTVEHEAGLRRSDLAKQLNLLFDGTYYQSFYYVRDEVAFNKVLLQKATMEYRQNPFLVPKCLGRNLVGFWFLGKTWQATGFNLLIQIPTLALAAAGILSLWKWGKLRKMGIMLAFIVNIVAVHAAVVAHARHSVPVIPFLMILASIPIVSVCRRYRAQSSTEHPRMIEVSESEDRALRGSLG
jgi:hypothetical protein